MVTYLAIYTSRLRRGPKYIVTAADLWQLRNAILPEVEAARSHRRAW